MGRDRTSVTRINGFRISVDKDHLGYYRGSQALDLSKTSYYRGWHYHVESDTISQLEIMQHLEQYLEKIGATRLPPETPLGIGIVEYHPAKISAWKLRNLIWDKQNKKWAIDTKTCVLWISGFNGKLHVEANKVQKYAKYILTKPILLELLKNWKIDDRTAYQKEKGIIESRDR